MEQLADGSDEDGVDSEDGVADGADDGVVADGSEEDRFGVADSSDAMEQLIVQKIDDDGSEDEESADGKIDIDNQFQKNVY